MTVLYEGSNASQDYRRCSGIRSIDVGLGAGAVVGTAIDPPPKKVVTYVREAPAPSARVVVKEKVVVGQPLPETVVVTPIPDDPKLRPSFPR